jgi:murein DD-endopeptidase MepM/ murein hydrolase activator NlpD
LNDKKKLQERFRKIIQKSEHNGELQIAKKSDHQTNDQQTIEVNTVPLDSGSNDNDKATHLDVLPKRRIEDRQNYKQTDRKVKQKKRFSTQDRFKQNKQSLNWKSQKNYSAVKSNQRVNNRPTSMAETADKDKIKTQSGPEKSTLNKQTKLKTHDFKKKKLHQKALGLPYVFKNTTDHYGRFEEHKDSDENSAVVATDESVTFVKRTLMKTKKTKHPSLKFEASKDKINGEFKEALSKHSLSHVKQSRANNITKPSKKDQHKRSIKKVYNMEKQSAFNTGIKDRIKNVFKQVKEWVTRGLKKFAIYMIGPVFMFVVSSVLILSMVQSFSGAVSTVVSTSYQSSDLVITNSDVMYTRLEADLLYAINHVEEDHPSYDEYRYNVDAVGHDPHIMVAYLTAKFGEYTEADVSDELSRIFDLQYNYRLIERVETRTRTVIQTSIDPVTGETITTTSEETYEWYVLEVILDTRDLQQVFESRLNEDEKDLYETLIITKGNFISLPSPIKEEWQNAVSSPFGYRLDPISKEVTFHAGIDIAKPIGTELVTIIDGKVVQTGYDADGYGHYIIVEEEKSNQTVLYGHCNRIIASEGDEVKIGQTIATIGSSGKSTGPHVYLEIRDSSGNTLNPYFYLSSEIVEENL